MHKPGEHVEPVKEDSRHRRRSDLAQGTKPVGSLGMVSRRRREMGSAADCHPGRGPGGRGPRPAAAGETPTKGRTTRKPVRGDPRVMKTITFNGTTHNCPFADLLPPLSPEDRAAL